MIKNIKEFINKSKTDLDLLLLGLLILSLPFERITSFDLYGVTIRASLVIGLTVILRAAYLLIKNKAKLNKSLPILLLAIFTFWIILIIPESINFQRAIQVVAYNIFVILLAVSVCLIYKKEYLKHLISLLFIVTLFVSAFAFYQFFGDIIGIPYEYTGLAERYTSGLFGFPRVQGFSLEPLYFGSFMLIPTMLALALIAAKDKTIATLKIQYFLLFVFSTVIFITVARGAIYGMAVGVIVLTIISLIKNISNWKNLATGLVIMVLAFGASLLIINYGSRIPLDLSKTFGKRGAAAFTQQLTRTTLNDTDERAIARTQAIDLLQNNKSAWVFGLGPGQFGPYIQNNTKTADGWAIVNNLTLELLVETGLVGFLLIVAYFLSLVVIGYKKVSANKKDLLSSAVTIGLIAYLSTQAIQYQGFSTLYVVHIWVVAGLLMGVALGNLTIRSK
jgi:O-antigen ligase